MTRQEQGEVEVATVGRRALSAHRWEGSDARRPEVAQGILLFHVLLEFCLHSGCVELVRMLP